MWESLNVIMALLRIKLKSLYRPMPLLNDDKVTFILNFLCRLSCDGCNFFCSSLGFGADTVAL